MNNGADRDGFRDAWGGNRDGIDIGGSSGRPLVELRVDAENLRSGTSRGNAQTWKGPARRRTATRLMVARQRIRGQETAEEVAWMVMRFDSIREADRMTQGADRVRESRGTVPMDAYRHTGSRLTLEGHEQVGLKNHAGHGVMQESQRQRACSASRHIRSR